MGMWIRLTLRACVVRVCSPHPPCEGMWLQRAVLINVPLHTYQVQYSELAWNCSIFCSPINHSLDKCFDWVALQYDLTNMLQMSISEKKTAVNDCKYQKGLWKLLELEEDSHNPSPQNVFHICFNLTLFSNLISYFMSFKVTLECWMVLFTEHSSCSLLLNQELLFICSSYVTAEGLRIVVLLFQEAVCGKSGTFKYLISTFLKRST